MLRDTTTKTDVVVDVIRFVVVTVRRTNVVIVVVPRTATKNANRQRSSQPRGVTLF